MCSNHTATCLSRTQPQSSFVAHYDIFSITLHRSCFVPDWRERVQKAQVYFEHTWSTGIDLPFNGVPFIIAGRQMFQCAAGPDRHGKKRVSEPRVCIDIVFCICLLSFLSVQCNVQHWTEYKTTLASVRPSGVRPDGNYGQHCELSSGPIFTKFGIQLPLNILKKMFSEQSLKWAWPGSRDPLNFWALNANNSKTVKATDFKFDSIFPGILRT